MHEVARECVKSQAQHPTCSNALVNACTNLQLVLTIVNYSYELHFLQEKHLVSHGDHSQQVIGDYVLCGLSLSNTSGGC